MILFMRNQKFTTLHLNDTFLEKIEWSSQFQSREDNDLQTNL